MEEGTTERNQTAERLLDAAERIYTAKGSRGMTTRAVAAEAGVSELTLFRHFGSKTALMEAMTRRLAEVPMVDRALAEAHTGDLERDLCHVARNIVANARPLLPFIQQVLAEANEYPERLEIAAARPVAALQRLAAFFKQRMDAGQVRRDDPLLMAHAFSAMVIFRVLGRAMYEGIITQPEEDVLQAFVRFFVHGVAAPMPPEVSGHGDTAPTDH